MPDAALPVLRTPRLTLRPLREEDADALVAGVGNYDVSRWLAVVPYPYGRDDALKFIRTVREERKPVWGIADDSGIVGTVSLDGELGYWLARPAWRKGYGFEAARAVVAHHFRNEEADELGSHVFVGNDQSGAVLRALGFVMRDRIRRYARSLSQAVDATEMVLTRERWDTRRTFTVFTPRLTLSPLEEEDAPDLLRLSDPRVALHTHSIPLDWTEAEATESIRARRWRGWPGFSLKIEQDGVFVGIVGAGNSPLSVMYALVPEAWGQGIATEALSAFLPELFERFPVNRIVADHFEDNAASARVLEKLGFVETGREEGASLARLEPAPFITYAVTRETLKVPA